MRVRGLRLRKFRPPRLNIFPCAHTCERTDRAAAGGQYDKGRKGEGRASFPGEAGPGKLPSFVRLLCAGTELLWRPFAVCTSISTSKNYE